jgi:hypothetical protein
LLILIDRRWKMVAREFRKLFFSLLVLLVFCIAVAVLVGCEKQMPVAPIPTLQELDIEEMCTNSPQMCSADSGGNRTITTRVLITKRFGGKLRIPRAAFLRVPPDAVDRNMWIFATVRLRQVSGNVDTLLYEFAPNNLIFNVPAALVLHYGHLDAEEGDDIVLYVFNEESEEWELIDEQRLNIDRKRRKMVFLISEFTRYFVARR